MPKFGKRSTKNLDQCDQQLQDLFNTVIKYYDCSVICGWRNKKEQDAAFAEGKSQKEFPNSKHNVLPSSAVDVVPWFYEKPHIRWNDKAKFYEFAGFVLGIAAMLGIKIRYGGNWDRDDELHDQDFYDLPHFELID